MVEAKRRLVVSDNVVNPHRWFQCGSGSSIFGQCGSGSGSSIFGQCGSGSKYSIFGQCGSGSDPDSGSDDQKFENFYRWKIYIYFLSKISIHLSLGLHKGHPSYRLSLNPSKENIQLFKTWNFFTFCVSVLPYLIRIRPTNAKCGSGSGSTPLSLIKLPELSATARYV